VTSCGIRWSSSGVRSCDERCFPELRWEGEEGEEGEEGTVDESEVEVVDGVAGAVR